MGLAGAPRRGMLPHSGSRICLEQPGFGGLGRVGTAPALGLGMSPKTRAKLVVMEPGVVAPAAFSAPAEQRHILLLGADESLVGFRDRVRRRTGSLRLAAQELSDVTYVIGRHHDADWPGRQSLLSELCDELGAEGSVAVVAPRSATSDVLGCIGDLQAMRASGVSLRAVFTDAETAA